MSDEPISAAEGDEHTLATAAAERGLGVQQRSGGSAINVAACRFALARALWDGGGDRRIAREHAEAALVGAEPEGAADVRRWLEQHRE